MVIVWGAKLTFVSGQIRVGRWIWEFDYMQSKWMFHKWPSLSVNSFHASSQKQNICQNYRLPKWAPPKEEMQTPWIGYGLDWILFRRDVFVDWEEWNFWFWPSHHGLISGRLCPVPGWGEELKVEMRHFKLQVLLHTSRVSGVHSPRAPNIQPALCLC